MLPSPLQCLHCRVSGRRSNFLTVLEFMNSSYAMRTPGLEACFFATIHHEASASVSATMRRARRTSRPNKMISIASAIISVTGMVSPSFSSARYQYCP